MSNNKTKREEALHHFRIGTIYINTAMLTDGSQAAELVYKGLCLYEKAARELGYESMADLSRDMNYSDLYRQSV